MKLVNREAEIAECVLNQWSGGAKAVGPWRWQCAVQNGTRLPVAARYDDGFLRLETKCGMQAAPALAPRRAIRWNAALAGGVKIAADAAARQLRLCADILVLDEAQLARRLEWSLDGFHECAQLLDTGGSEDAETMPRREDLPLPVAQHLLENTSWPFTRLESGEYSVALEADGARPARVRADRCHILVFVDLVCTGVDARLADQALASYLLAATGTLRMVRACCVEAEARSTFSLAVLLPAAALPEELDHALASLSAAHRICAREANALLDESVAGRYLAVRESSTPTQTQDREE